MKDINIVIEENVRRARIIAGMKMRIFREISRKTAAREMMEVIINPK